MRIAKIVKGLLIVLAVGIAALIVYSALHVEPAPKPTDEAWNRAGQAREGAQ